VPNDVPPVEFLSKLFSALGLTRDTHVVAYDDEGGGWAARLLWTLELIGHTRYSYLNGGIHAWRDAGLEESTEPTAPTPSEYHAEILNPSAAITCDEIKEKLSNKQFAIWDARSKAEYDGERGNNKHLGHIPGAVNMDWRHALPAYGQSGPSLDPAALGRIRLQRAFRHPWNRAFQRAGRVRLESSRLATAAGGLIYVCS